MATPVRHIVLESGALALRARLLDTPTAAALWARLPLEGTAGRWGDEVYLPTELAVPREAGARQVVERGELCYWCEGRALAVAFGPTPISLAEECRLVAPVNVWGALLDPPERLAAVDDGARIVLRRETP